MTTANQTQEDPDDRFSECLAAFDEALAAGKTPDPAAATAPPQLRERLRQAEACLLLLEQTRPAKAKAETIMLTADDAMPTPAPTADRPETIGRFRILRELGRGGCGVVFLAHDPALRRQLALKVPLPEVLATAEYRKRFLREGQAAAQLNHPNVVPVYESGEAGPIAYIASAYCPGPTLAAWLKTQKTPVPPSAAAALVAQLADAVHHCHLRGCLHRDLKPGNVILQIADGNWDEQNPQPVTCDLKSVTPKITDFGLARMDWEANDKTRTGAIMGTAAYMAPEQAQANAAQFGPHTDVYALGVILFEMLTGQPPFVGANALETMQRVVHDEPPWMQKFGRSVHRDLETICRKCLEKTPQSRYGSAAELALDLMRFVRGEPIMARPVGTVGRAWRWCRRNPSWALLLTLACLVAFVVLPSWQWFRVSLEEADQRNMAAEQEIGREKNARRAAEENAKNQRYYSLLNRVRQRNLQRPLGWTWAGSADIAEAARLDIPARNWVDLRTEAATILVGVDVREKKVLAEDFNAYCLAFSPDGKFLAAGQDMATAFIYAPIRITEVATGKTHLTLTYPTKLARLPTGSAPDGAICLAYSADGKYLAVGTRSGQVHCWDLTQAKPKPVSWAASKERIHHLIFHPRQPVLYTASRAERFIKRWEATSGKESASFEAPDLVYGLSLHPDGKTLAFTGDSALHFLNADSLRDLGSTRRDYQDVGYPIQVRYSSLGNLLVLETGERVVVLLDAAGRRGRRFADPGGDFVHLDELSQLEFLPDDSLLLTSSANERDRTLKIWETASGRLLATMHLGESGPLAFAIDPGGKFLATAANHRIVLHELTNRGVQSFRGQQPWRMQDAAFSSNGCLLAGSAEYREGDKLVHYRAVWRTDSGKLCYEGAHPSPGRMRISLATYPAEPIWAVTGPLNLIVFFDTKDWNQPPVTADMPSLVAFDRAGAKAWAVVKGDTIKSWHFPSRKPASEWRLKSLNFEGRDNLYCLAVGRQWLLTGARDGKAHLLRVSDGQPHTSWLGPDIPVRSVAINGDETWAAVGSQDGAVRIMSVPEGKVLATLRDHTDSVDGVATDSTEQFLVTCSKENRVHIYTLAGHLPTLYATLTLPSGPVRGLSFMPHSQKFVLIAGPETAVRLWDLNELQRHLTVIGVP
jgi:WD40 repeat protein